MGEDGWMAWGCDAVVVTRAAWITTSKTGETERSCKALCLENEECNSINFRGDVGECALWHAHEPRQPEVTREGYAGWCTWSLPPTDFDGFDEFEEGHVEHGPDGDAEARDGKDEGGRAGLEPEANPEGSDLRADEEGAPAPSAPGDGQDDSDVPRHEGDMPAGDAAVPLGSELERQATEGKQRLVEALHLEKVSGEELAPLALALARNASRYAALLRLMAQEIPVQVSSLCGPTLLDPVAYLPLPLRLAGDE